MKEVNCNIIQDILPLYEDGVVCEDTAELVRDHLKVCVACRQELKKLRLPVCIPPEADAHMLKGIQKRWRMARLKTALGVLCIVAILAAIVAAAMWYTRPQSLDAIFNPDEITSLEHGSVWLSDATVHELELDTSDHTWVLDHVEPGTQAFMEILSLLESSSYRASLRNLLGSPDWSGNGDSIHLIFLISGERSIRLALTADGTVWFYPSWTNRSFKYTQTNGQLPAALITVFLQYGAGT